MRNISISSGGSLAFSNALLTINIKYSTPFTFHIQSFVIIICISYAVALEEKRGQNLLTSRPQNAPAALQANVMMYEWLFIIFFNFTKYTTPNTGFE